MATLRQIREDNLLSRRELAELAGVAESTIVRLETTRTHTTPEIAKKLVVALETRIGKPLTLEDIEGLRIYNIMRDRRHRKASRSPEEAA